MPKDISSKKAVSIQLPVNDTCDQICYDAPLVSALKQQMLADKTVMELAATFEVLADPTRIRIIHALSRDELCVCDLAHVLGMSMSAISHQLRRLRDLHLVKYRYEGRMAFYSLDDEFTKRMLEGAIQHVETD
jgi:DNA-binding transcriptional ArsR family regulator